MMYDYIIVDKENAYVRKEGGEWPKDDFFQSQELLRLATSKAWEGHEVVAIKENGDSYTLEKRNFTVDMYDIKRQLVCSFIKDREGHKDWLEETM